MFFVFFVSVYPSWRAEHFSSFFFFFVCFCFFVRAMSPRELIQLGLPLNVAGDGRSFDVTTFLESRIGTFLERGWGTSPEGFFKELAEAKALEFLDLKIVEGDYMFILPGEKFRIVWNSRSESEVTEKLLKHGAFSIHRHYSTGQVAHSGFKHRLFVDFDKFAVALGTAFIKAAKDDEGARTQAAVEVLFGLNKVGMGYLKDQILGDASPRNSDSPVQKWLCTTCNGALQRAPFNASPSVLEAYIIKASQIPALGRKLGFDPPPALFIMYHVLYGIFYDFVLNVEGRGDGYLHVPELRLLLHDYLLGKPIHAEKIFWPGTRVLDHKVDGLDAFSLVEVSPVKEDSEPRLLSPVEDTCMTTRLWRDHFVWQSEFGANSYPVAKNFGSLLFALTPAKRGIQLSLILEYFFETRTTHKYPLYRLLFRVILTGDLEIATRVLRSWLGVFTRHASKVEAEHGELPSRLLNRDCWFRLFEFLTAIPCESSSTFSQVSLTLLNAFVQPYDKEFWVHGQRHMGTRQNADEWIVDLMLTSSADTRSAAEMMLGLRSSRQEQEIYGHKKKSDTVVPFYDTEAGDVPVDPYNVHPAVRALFRAEYGPSVPEEVGDPNMLGCGLLAHRQVAFDNLIVVSTLNQAPDFEPPKIEDVRQIKDCRCEKPKLAPRKTLEQLAQQMAIDKARTEARERRRREAEEAESHVESAAAVREFAKSNGL